MTEPSLVGIIGSAIGRQPFDLRSWSGSSHYFFTELQRQRMLHEAFGVELPKVIRYAHIARNVHPVRQKWLNRFWLDLRYRKALTDVIHRRLATMEPGHEYLQIGGYFDVHRAVRGRARCFAYYDGNLVSRLRSGYKLGASDSVIQKAVDYERELLSRVSAVFTFSDYLRDSFIADYSLPPDKVFTIGGGINMDIIPPFNAAKRYDTGEILFIGVDFERKGGRDALLAFKGVRTAFPKAVFHIVGPRSLEIPPELADGVQMHGYISKSDPRLQDLFERASLFVMPSLFEPFGIAPLEAMVNQVPPIVTDGWAFREMVIPGVCGDLVAPRSPKDLEAKMIFHLSDPDGLRTMGTAGRERVLAHYTWQDVVRRLRSGLADVRSRP